MKILEFPLCRNSIELLPAYKGNCSMNTLATYCNNRSSSSWLQISFFISLTSEGADEVLVLASGKQFLIFFKTLTHKLTTPWTAKPNRSTIFWFLYIHKHCLDLNREQKLVNELINHVFLSIVRYLWTHIPR